LEVRQPLEEEDALDESLRVLHLVDRFLPEVMRQPGEAAVTADLGAQEVLIDRGELADEKLVEEVDDRLGGLHAAFDCGPPHSAARTSRMSSRHVPPSAPRP